MRSFELIITLTGSARSTGQMTQSRTSYLPREVLWGYHFQNLISYDRQENCYQADYDRCDNLVQVDTPLCSARRLDEVLDECREFVKQQETAAGDESTTESDMLMQTSVGGGRVQFRHLERLAEELEYRLSNHSLQFEQQQQLMAAAAGRVDGGVLVFDEKDEDGVENDIGGRSKESLA